MSIKIKNKRPNDPQEQLSEKLGLFDKLPSECLVCESPFDKKNKEMVMDWYVVVREKQGQVNLYCPPCWAEANKFLEEFKNDKPNS